MMQNARTDSDSLIVAQALPVEGKAVLMTSVGQNARDQIALDDGIDYFSAQGALDRWRLLNKAEGRIE